MNRLDRAVSFLEGGGELGALMRAHDWSKTPLGVPSKWPQSLKTAVRIMLTSRQPFWLGWGPELTYLYNDPYQSIIGGKHPWALGRPFSEVWSEIWDVVGPMAETVMTRNEGTYVEAQLLIMERHGYPEETYYTFSYSPIPGDDGRPGGLICANTDDTQRVIGERQLALLRELAAKTGNARRWQDACTFAIEAFDSNPHDVPFALIYIADGPGEAPRLACASTRTERLQQIALWPIDEIMRSGECKVVALAQAEQIPTGAWPQPPRQVAVFPIAGSGQTVRSGALVVGLNPFRKFSDSYRNFFELAAGQIAAAMANAQAYEDEKKRAESLAQLDRAKTTFFSNVSHELRTPLTLMLGPITDIASSAHEVDTDEVQRLASIAQRSGVRLLKLVNTLLDFSRIEAGRVQAQYEPVDLARLTADVASTFRSAVEKAGMRLTISCPSLREPVYADREMWEKIVLNLVSNAFKFTLEGQIDVSLAEQDGWAVLEVRDTGCGIPQTELSRIFERFHRVSGSHGRSVEGTGIGLALTQELVKLHGGTVSVESTEGVGSRFIVRVPLGRTHLPAEHIVASRSVHSSAAGASAYVEEALRWLPDTEQGEPRAVADGRAGDASATILLADDNADMREYVKRLLAPRYNVIAVADGREALHALESHPVQLALTDVMMPNVDGFELLKAIRADSRCAHIPVIMLSARAGEEARLEGLSAGADDYLVKPFSARELLARVDGQIAALRLRSHSLDRERVLRNEAEALNEIARELAAELDVQTLLQKVTDSATKASGAKFGAFFYNTVDERGESYMLYTLSGAPREAFARFSMPRNTDIFRPTFEGRGVVRLDDVTRDPRYGHNPPHHGMPRGHLPVRSYLAVAVTSRSGSVIGGLFFGHPETGVFTEPAERPVSAIAAQAAIAIDNARLYESAQKELAQRARTERELAAIKDDLALQVSGLTRLHHLVMKLGEMQTLDEMLHEVLRAAADVHGTDRGLLSLYDTELGMLCVRASIGFDQAILNRIPDLEPGPAAGACGSAFFTKARVTVADTELDGRFEAYKAVARDAGFRAVHSMPIFKNTGEILGVLSVHFEQPYTPTQLQIQLAEMCARYAADAIESARAEAALREDIERRRAAESALQEADRRKDEFLATLAHELRNPLAPLANGLEIQRRAAGNLKLLADVRDLMDRQLKHMVRLVDDLLDLSRVSRGRVELRKQRIDVATVLRTAIETSGPLIDAARHHLTTRIPLEPIYIDADLTRMAQVIANLLNNAAKYGGPAGGEITLSAERSGELAVVRVKDNGIGIPADALVRVFDMFAQVERSIEKSHGGLGIGLTLVRRLVEMHGGTVEAFSAGEGKGSEFVVRIPALDEPSEAHTAREDSSDKTKSNEVALRILVADDNVDAARTLATLLELHGHHVTVVHDGLSAVSTARELRPTAVLLDIGMPGMNGYEACQSMREEAWAKDVMFVAITGWGQDEDRRRAASAGFTHHLTKPVDSAELQKLFSTGVAA